MGDLVWVPFPFVEEPRLRERPALIISRPWEAAGFRLYWTMMVTSIANAGWPDDIEIGDRYEEFGLPAPSVIRPAKIASITEESARRLGRLPAFILDEVSAVTRLAIGLDENR